HAQALGGLSGRLSPPRAARVAEELIALLGDRDTLGYTYVTEALTAVAERLDAQGGLRAAEGLILVLRRKADDFSLVSEPRRAALVAVCRRPDAAGAARVSEAIVAAVRDPQTSARARVLFADALGAVGDRLGPAGAASLEGALVEALAADLADARSLPVRALLGQALASVCGGPGATSAARAAEALVAAIRDPQTPLVALKPLAEALAAV